MPEHGNLLIGESAFHAILIVAQAVIFLLVLFVDYFSLVEVTWLLNVPRIMRW